MPLLSIYYTTEICLPCEIEKVVVNQTCKINVIRSDDDDDNDSCEWRREFSSFVVSFFKVHTCIESESTIADYFALNDLTEICLIQQCGYEHDQHCDKCHSLDVVRKTTSASRTGDSLQLWCRKRLGFMPLQVCSASHPRVEKPSVVIRKAR